MERDDLTFAVWSKLGPVPENVDKAIIMNTTNHIDYYGNTELGYCGATHNGVKLPDEEVRPKVTHFTSAMEIQAHDDPRNKVFDSEVMDWVPEVANIIQFPANPNHVCPVIELSRAEFEDKYYCPMPEDGNEPHIKWHEENN